MDKLDSSQLAELFSAVGEHLTASGDSASIVVVGGSTLAARGWVERTTADVDVIARAIKGGGRRTLVAPDPLPTSLVMAIERVGRDYGLPQDWMNTVIGMQWLHGLPPGFAEEIEWRQFDGLEVGFAGRQTLIALKLFDAVDRGRASVHVQDLVALQPTDAELAEAAAWVRTQDANAHFPKFVEEVLSHVRRGLGRGIAPS